MLSTCSDDGTIILKFIKSLLEPLSADLVKEYAGEEAGVGLYGIGNTLAECENTEELMMNMDEEEVNDLSDTSDSMMI